MRSKSEPDCIVYNQYLDTNIQTLIEGKCQIYNSNITPYKHSFDEFSNLNIATGTALDHKGRLLNMSRYITFNDRLNVVLPDTEGISEYKYLQGDTKQCRLDDKAYRIVLRLLAQSKNTVASVETLSKIISDIVEADVFVGDNMDMRYITYYFLDRIPGWLEVTMHNYDILPRPAGMETRYISAISRLFGFLISFPHVDREATAKVFSAFWKTRFPDKTSQTPHHTNSFSSLIQHEPYKYTTLTEEVFLNMRALITEKQSKDRQELEDTMQAENEINHRGQENDLIKAYNYKYLNSDFTRQDSITQQLYEAEYNSRDSWRDKKGDRMEKLMTYRVNTMNSLRQREEFIQSLRPYQLKQSRYDLRVGLYFDKTTGWYYYAPPDNGGRFDPATVALLYQDDCGLWHPQDSLALQLQTRKIHLRSDDYYNDRISKTLTTSPFLTTYQALTIPLNLPNLRSDLETYIYNFHDAIKLYHKAHLINKYTFRKILDLEYMALGIVRRTVYYEKRSDPDAKIYNDPLKYYNNQIATRLRRYIGKATGYSQLFSSSNRDAPIYKHRQLLIYLRRQYKQLKDRMTTSYDENYRLYNKLRNSIDNLTSDFYYKISWYRDQLDKEEYYTNYEKSHECGCENKDWSQVNKTNQEVKDRYEFLEKEASWWEGQASRLDTAVNSCNNLANRCDNGTGNSGQWSAVRACWTIKDNTNWITGNNPSSNANTEANGKESSYYNLSCSEYRDRARAARDWATDKRNAASNNRKIIPKLKAEFEMRTTLTQSKTLKRILQDYETMSFDSSITFPEININNLPKLDFPII